VNSYSAMILLFMALIYAITLGKYFFKPNKTYLDYNNDNISSDSYEVDDIEILKKNEHFMNSIKSIGKGKGWKL